MVSLDKRKAMIMCRGLVLYGTAVQLDTNGKKRKGEQAFQALKLIICII